MTVTLNLLAPSATPFAQFAAKSGTTYTADANGMVKSVALVDIADLEADGCITLGILGAKSNLTATTNPGVTNDSTQDFAIGSHWLNKSTGVEYVATSVTSGAANWVALNGSFLGLPQVTGRFYGLPPGATQAAVLTVLGTLYAVPVFIPNAVTLSTINMSVTTGQTGGKARGALFYDNGAGYPGAIVPLTDTGDLAATATAVVAKSSLTTALGAGWYWFGSIYTASSTMPSVIGATATYANIQNALLGCDTAAHALATSGDAVTGIAITGQTYPATDMPTSFPTFPASAALQVNVTTPISALGV